MALDPYYQDLINASALDGLVRWVKDGYNQEMREAARNRLCAIAPHLALEPPLPTIQDPTHNLGWEELCQTVRAQLGNVMYTPGDLYQHLVSERDAETIVEWLIRNIPETSDALTCAGPCTEHALWGLYQLQRIDPNLATGTLDIAMIIDSRTEYCHRLEWLGIYLNDTMIPNIRIMCFDLDPVKEEPSGLWAWDKAPVGWVPQGAAQF